MTGTFYESWFTPEEKARFDEIRPQRDARRANPDPELWREMGFSTKFNASRWFRVRGYHGGEWDPSRMEFLPEKGGPVEDWKDKFRYTLHGPSSMKMWRPPKLWKGNSSIWRF